MPLKQDAEAVGRLGIVLKKHIHGRQLDEVEMAIERPPRQDLIEDAPGMFLADHGEYEEGGERRKLYRLELAGDMAAFFSIALNSGARIERFCLPHEVSETADAIHGAASGTK